MWRAILLITTILFSGCASNQVVRPGEVLIIEKQAKLLTKAGQSLDVYSIMLDGDSLVAFDLRTQNPYSFHVTEVGSIIVTNRFKGAMMVGGVGFVVFGIPAYSIAPSFSYGFPLLLFFGSIGGGIGSIGGAMVGYKENYLFECDPQAVEPLDSIKSTGLERMNGEKHEKIDIQTDTSQAPILKQARMRLPANLSQPNNQIAGALLLRGEDHKTETVFGFSARRFYSWETGYYLKYAYRYVEGTSPKGWDYYHWRSEYHQVSLGYEGFRMGNIQNGGSPFIELGMTSGEMKESTSRDYEDGPGLAVGFGMRGWSHLLFGEVQFSYDTMNGHLIPCLVAGYRF